jgi:hypothetical protein
MTPDEVEYFVERAASVMGRDAEQRFREFASTDDGNEYSAVNLDKYREKPKYRDGRDRAEISFGGLPGWFEWPRYAVTRRRRQE